MNHSIYFLNLIFKSNYKLDLVIFTLEVSPNAIEIVFKAKYEFE